ncbi:hypothetical protein D2Q93_04315 [Alicyclobacillaceae bacterium I2511]|nr:hypothetical protein D2Q93_04315 [Alicyclobacillaceae bacterium I2511]
MKRSPQQIHDLLLQVRRENWQSIGPLCQGFMPEIRRATRLSGRMQPEAIQEVCEILIREVITKKFKNV